MLLRRLTDERIAALAQNAYPLRFTPGSRPALGTGLDHRVIEPDPGV